MGVERVVSLAEFIGECEALGFNAQEVQNLAAWRNSLVSLSTQKICPVQPNRLYIPSLFSPRHPRWDGLRYLSDEPLTLLELMDLMDESDPSISWSLVVRIALSLRTQIWVWR